MIVASVSAGMKQIAAWWKETESQKLDDRVLSGTSGRMMMCLVVLH